MSKLLEAQFAFMRALPKWMIGVQEMGYQLTEGDGYRDDRCQYGSLSSKHKVRLAHDFNLFKNGKYVTTVEGWREAGEYWETFGGIWGGRWTSGQGSGDANHLEWPYPV